MKSGRVPEGGGATSGLRCNGMCVNDAYLNCHQSKLTVPLMLVKQR